MDDTGIPTNVSYSQQGFNQPPMINTGGLGSGGMGPMSSPVSGPTSPGMSSGIRSGCEVWAKLSRVVEKRTG